MIGRSREWLASHMTWYEHNTVVWLHVYPYHFLSPSLTLTLSLSLSLSPPLPQIDQGPAASSFESPSKVGWLYKHGGSGVSSHWRKRWFVADHHYLFYYKGPNVSFADSAINLRNGWTTLIKCVCVCSQKIGMIRSRFALIWILSVVLVWLASIALCSVKPWMHLHKKYSVSWYGVVSLK